MAEEREATMEDMIRFWPDKTPEALAAAFEQIKAAGGTMTVVPDEGKCGDPWDCRCHHGCDIP